MSDYQWLIPLTHHRGTRDLFKNFRVGRSKLRTLSFWMMIFHFEELKLWQVLFSYLWTRGKQFQFPTLFSFGINKSLSLEVYQKAASIYKELDFCAHISYIHQFVLNTHDILESYMIPNHLIDHFISALPYRLPVFWWVMSHEVTIISCFSTWRSTEKPRYFSSTAATPVSWYMDVDDKEPSKKVHASWSGTKRQQDRKTGITTLSSHQVLWCTLRHHFVAQLRFDLKKPRSNMVTWSVCLFLGSLLTQAASSKKQVSW